MKPEQAIPAARAAASQERAAGAYGEDLHAITLNPTHERVSSDQLMEWALIEPDPALVTSTRSLGGPISRVKGMLIHLLRQYHGQLESQQTRFNVHVLARVVELEERLAIIEDWLRDELPGPSSLPAGARPRAAGPSLGAARARATGQGLAAGPARPRDEWLSQREPDSPAP